MKGNLTRRPAVTFLLITFALSSIFYFLIIHTGTLGSGYGLYVTGLMWCPGISAILTSLLMKRSISELGWQWGKTKYQWWSYLVPLAYALIAYIIIWSFGWGGFYNMDTVTNISSSFGWEPLPEWLVIALFFILMGIIGIPGSVATAMGEEIGWRGFLVPELFKHMSYTKTALLSGIIWTAWHVPVLLFADYNSGTPAWYGLSCFAVMVTSISFIFAWLRLKSYSLWTGVLLHASHNLFIQSIFTPLTRDSGNTKYFIDEFGIVLPVVCLGFAIYFWSRRGELVRGPDEMITEPILTANSK